MAGNFGHEVDGGVGFLVVKGVSAGGDDQGTVVGDEVGKAAQEDFEVRAVAVEVGGVVNFAAEKMGGKSAGLTVEGERNTDEDTTLVVNGGQRGIGSSETQASGTDDVGGVCRFGVDEGE